MFFMEDRGLHSRTQLRPVAAWSLALILYLFALALAGDAARLVNNVAWSLAALAASVSAWLTVRRADLNPMQRRGWGLIAAGAGVWFLGQLVWAYYDLVAVGGPAYPLVSRICYLACAALLLRAVGWLSDSTEHTRFTVLHLGNLSLICCCFAVTLLVAFMEPIARTRGSSLNVVAALAHSTFIAMIFFASLYYLWTQRWLASWVPMLLISCGAAVYAIGNFVYVHELLIGSYRHADWVNVSWVVAFLAFGLAAHLRRLPVVVPADLHAATSRRTRQLEAAIPALLIILIVVVGTSLADQITPRVIVAVAAFLLIFAFILGAREAWIQAEAQRLTRELRTANELLLGTNRELQASEARVRDLNVHLEERVADRTRQMQSAYEELEGFAYAVAHDLRAPLRAIDGFSQLLEEAMQPHADAKSSGYLARMRRGATKMAALIEDLLAYSRIERRALSPEPVQLDTLVADVVAECSADIEARNLRLQVDVPSISMNVDVEALTLVVRNLLHNALKFTRRAHSAQISIAARSDGERVELIVRDNGIGFDMQYHDQIFKLFHRLHRDEEYQGTGIGLALVRKALERMNGRVRAASHPGEGATFAIELPTTA